MKTIAHISDLHFGKEIPAVADGLAADLQALAPSLVVASGDFTQRARRKQFAAARDFLARLPKPQLVIPGNHDVPLFNLAARFFDPFGGYQRHIQSDLEPVFEGEGFIAVGLNTARNFPFHGGGRLNETQVSRAAARLAAARDGAIKIVVTHHPFDLPDTHGDEHLVGRSGMAMRRFADAGADIFLAGHLHVSHVGHSAARYQIAGHSALVVQAGTLSTRQRGEVNSINLLRLAGETIDVDRYAWDDSTLSFQLHSNRPFHRGSEGWFSR